MIVLFWQSTVARLRRPAIVASVAMKGGSRSKLIIKRMTEPDRRSHEQRQTDRQRDRARSTAAADDRVAQPLGQQLGADDRRERDDGAGRKVDSAGDDHHRRADGQHAEEGDRVQKRLKTVALVERAIAVQQIDDRQDDQNARRQGRFLGLEEARQRAATIGLVLFLWTFLVS